MRTIAPRRIFLLGGACALSVMLLALLGAFSAGYLRLTRSSEEATA